MCRWFGYRPKYEDLCRIYITQENIDRFDAVLDAVEDMKLQFAEMDRKGKTPKEFGLMIKECPDTLETTMLITARNKMRGTEVIEYRLNYGGVYADTSKLSRDPAVNMHNLVAYKKFASKVSFKKEHGRYWMAQQVKKYDIAELIRALKIPYVNKKFDTEGLAEYIENSDIFPYWDVVIATGSAESLVVDICDNERGVARSFHVKGESDPYIRIGGSNNRVMDPGVFDAGLWLSDSQRQDILTIKNNNAPDGKTYSELSATDYLERRSCPLLVIYPIELKVECSDFEKKTPGTDIDALEKLKKKIKSDIGEDIPLMAFAFGFPRKESGVTVVYRANKVKLDELNANLEVYDDEEGADDDDD
jgi:hypothetical protein